MRLINLKMNEHEFIGRIKEIMRLHKKKVLTNVKALERIEEVIKKLKQNE